MLQRHCCTAISDRFEGQACDLVIALHARRSAASIAEFAQRRPGRPLIVVLTGTDLYRDIDHDPQAQQSLRLATQLVVLQDQAPQALHASLRHKCSVIYQSAPRLQPLPPLRRVLRVIQVGHLRDEKDPLTFMRAALRLRHRSDIHWQQIGEALDPAWASAAQRTVAGCPPYRWRGGLPRAAARQQIRHAQLLVNSSRMEGGAQVVLEAAQSGTAVVASRIAGNVGMLGADHAGYFDLGDDAGLARLVERARDEPAFLEQLRDQTQARAPLFEPAVERNRLIELVMNALENPR